MEIVEATDIVEKLTEMAIKTLRETQKKGKDLDRKEMEKMIEEILEVEYNMRVLAEVRLKAIIYKLLRKVD